MKIMEIQWGPYQYTHVCTRTASEEQCEWQIHENSLSIHDSSHTHTILPLSSSRSLRPALAQYICVYDGHLLLCHKNEMTITIRMDETEKR